MPSTHHERLQVAVDEYAKVVERVIRDLTRVLIVDTVFIVIIPIGLSLAALRWSGMVGFATTLGLAGINANERFMRGQTMLKSYWSESSKLHRTVETLKLELSLCDPSNEDRLNKIENSLKEFLAFLP